MSSAAMDSDGEPSRIRDYDVDTTKSLSRAISFPNWHSIWSQQCTFDDDNSLLIGSCDDFSLSVAWTSECKTQRAGSNTTEWHLKRRKYDSKLVHCETWSYALASSTHLLSDTFVIQRQQTASTDEPSVVTFNMGEESTETEHAAATSLSSATERSKPDSNRQDTLASLHDLVPAQSNHHSLILSAIKSWGLTGSKDDSSLAKEEFHQNHIDAQSCSLTQQQQQQQQQDAVSHQRRPTLFGLPDRISVTKREMNMMSPISF